MATLPGQGAEGRFDADARGGAQWALSRPMLGLILTNPEAFEAIKQVRCPGRLLISIGLENLPETILMG